MCCNFSWCRQKSYGTLRTATFGLFIFFMRISCRSHRVHFLSERLPGHGATEGVSQGQTATSSRTAVKSGILNAAIQTLLPFLLLPSHKHEHELRHNYIICKTQENCLNSHPCTLFCPPSTCSHSKLDSTQKFRKQVTHAVGFGKSVPPYYLRRSRENAENQSHWDLVGAHSCTGSWNMLGR